MLNLDKICNDKSDDENWPFRMLIIGPSGSDKTNTLLHLIQNLNKATPIDKIYLYAKDLSEPKYEFLINNRKIAGIKHFNDPTVFIDIQMTWMMFLPTLTIIINKENEKC